MATIFKGPQFYTEGDKSIFKGRDNETDDLLYLVENNDFSVCYAVSGEGKSSLINAGLSPKLREHGFLPIHIKNIADAGVKHFDVFVWQKVEDAIKEEQKKPEYAGLAILKLEPQPDSQELADSVWWKLRTREFRLNSFETVTPVLIFDQFEEVFSSAKDLVWTDAFFAWLEGLYNDENTLAGEYSGRLQKKFKALFSLRSEYVCELDYWTMNKYFIPSLKNNRYYLKPLTKGAALEVAGLLKSPSNSSNVHNVVKYAKSERVGEWESIRDDIPCVSALILSLLLTGLSEKNAELESKIENINKSSGIDKEKELFDFLLENVYQRAIAKCNESDNIEVKKFIETLEDTLVDVNGKRRHVPERELPAIDDDKIKEALEILESERIINVIDHHYEISHDSLCAVIYKRKEKRAEELNKEKIREAVKEQRKRALKYFSYILIVLLVVFMFYVVIDNRRTHELNYKLLNIQPRFIGEKVNQLVKDGDSYLGCVLALSVLEDKYSYSWEAASALLNAYTHPSATLQKYGQDPHFSTDGRTIAFRNSGKYEDCIVVLDALNGRILNTLGSSEERILKMSFSYNGEYLAAVSNKNFLRFWNLNTGSTDSLKITKAENITSISFSPFINNCILWSVDSTLCIYNIKTQKENKQNYHKKIFSAKYSKDGNIIALAFNDVIKFLQSKDLTPYDSVSFESRNSDITIGYVSEKKVIVKLGNTVRVYNQENKTFLESHTDKLFAVTQDGRTIVTDTLNENGSVLFVRDTNHGHLLKSWQTDRLENVDINSQTNLIVMQNKHDDIILKELKPQYEKNFQSYYIYRHGYAIDYSTVSGATYNREGKSFTSFINSEINVWDVENGVLTTSIPTENSYLSKQYYALSPSGQYVAFYNQDFIKLRDLKRGQTISTNCAGIGLTFASTDDFLYFAGGNSYEGKDSITKWNISTHTVDKTYHFPEPIQSFNIGKQFLVFTCKKEYDSKTGEIRDRIKIWDGIKNKCLNEMKLSNIDMSFGCYSSGEIIGMIGLDSVRVYNVLSNKILFTKSNMGYEFRCMAFSNNNDRVALGKKDGTVEVVGLDGNVIYKLPISDYQSTINSVEFSPDGNWLLVACEKGLVKMTYCPPFHDLINSARKRYNSRKLTHQEKEQYYLQ